MDHPSKGMSYINLDFFFFNVVSEPYGDVVSSQGVAQHLEIKSSSRPSSPFSLHPSGGVVVQSNHPTHVVVLQPTSISHGTYLVKRFTHTTLDYMFIT